MLHAPRRLESGEVDFVIGPEIDVLNQHPHEVLFEETYTLIAWAGSTVVGDSVNFDEYMGLRHVVFRSEHRGVAWLERWFASRYGDARQVDVAVPEFSLLPHLVVGTDRIATLQTRLAKQYSEALPIKLIAPPVEFPRLTEVLQWNIHRDPDPSSRWFRTILLEHAAGMPPA